MLGNTIIGVLLALISTILFNLAPLLEKQALDKMKKIQKGNLIKSFTILIKNKLWVLGILLTVVGGIPYFLALQIAGITVVQPILNFGFIVLVISAYKFLGEKLDNLSKIAIGLMIIMPAFIAFGNVSSPIQFKNPITIIYFTIIVSSVAIFLCILGRKIPILWAPACGLFFSLGALYLQSFILPIDFNVLFSNTASVLATIVTGMLYLILCLFFNILATILSQFGLQRNLASRFNPINQILNNIFSSIGGIIIFSQIINAPIYYTIGFILGIIGVLILGRYSINNEQKINEKLD